MGYTPHTRLKPPWFFLQRCDIQSLLLSSEDKYASSATAFNGAGQPQHWAAVALHPSEEFPGPRGQEFRLHQTKLSTDFLGQGGLTPALWPHFQFLIKYL